MPVRGRQRGHREDGRLALAQRPQRGPQVAQRALGDLPEVGLRDDEHVGDLHDPGLEELQRVARAGLHDDHDRVGGARHVGLGLPDPDRLDDNDVERGRQRLRGRARRGREAAEALAGRHRADEHPAVGGIGLDPRPVAEQRATRAPGGRIDREHRDAAPTRPPVGDQRAEQRRLADPGWAGDAHDVTGRLAAQPRGRHLGQERGDLRPQRLRAVLHEVQDRRRGGQVAVAQPGAERGAGGQAAAACVRATSATMSRMILDRSKSFGV